MKPVDYRILVDETLQANEESISADWVNKEFIVFRRSDWDNAETCDDDELGKCKLIPIEKKKCEHEVYINLRAGSKLFKCSLCEKELKATGWETV